MLASSQFRQMDGVLKEVLAGEVLDRALRPVTSGRRRSEPSYAHRTLAECPSEIPARWWSVGVRGMLLRGGAAFGGSTTPG
ncbi:hypothetical protein GCM10023336_40320 [Streptomyces similanensis]|uniref:Uncharacterized protein n=1 Tax=Streptomyces similanensis TaxID=1274988 RepID=A0ABP9KQ95_9ACTN